MKRCCRCGELKPLNDFYRYGRSRDGHKAHCKVCDVAARDKWREDHPEQKKRSDRKHREQNPESSRAAAKRFRQRHTPTSNPDPQKARARKALNHAVEKGELHKPDCCERCNAVVESRLLHGHHEDHSKPLEVEWLCSTCHGLRHRED